ncbi:hypothetical protein ACYULU_13290 [Breznakiellaceae bacterium SP9]
MGRGGVAVCRLCRASCEECLGREGREQRLLRKPDKGRRVAAIKDEEIDCSDIPPWILLRSGSSRQWIEGCTDQ